MKIALILTIALALGACTDPVKPVAQNTNSAAQPARERPQTAIAHSSENQTPAPAAGSQSKWSQSGDPVDMTEYDSAIMSAEKALAAKPTDGKAKLALGEAYLKRATALTEARQYASALGDYRRTLKYDPANKDAKTWIDQIVMIYSSINRASPNEGEEPPPLPFKKPV
ncbi:MAG: hypothetical protein WKF34_13355 [Pyrinomonadaceae bacterium]